MSHIQLTINGKSDIYEILIAELSELGYDSFLEDDDSLIASIAEGDFSEAQLDDVMHRYKSSFELDYKWEQVAPQNWNKLWESNYPYVIVNDRCAVKAEFHKLPKKYDYEILITPKMSFGTGHHSTTTLMLQTILEYDFKGKTVLDLGTGTGVLFIMALMLGAEKSLACDIEEWAVENAIENAQKNNVENFEVYQGTAAELPNNTSYDYVFANINKNVILSELPMYAKSLKNEATLITSGFYESDLVDVEKIANENGLTLLKSQTLNNWVVGTFRKTD